MDRLTPVNPDLFYVAGQPRHGRVPGGRPSTIILRGRHQTHPTVATDD